MLSEIDASTGLVLPETSDPKIKFAWKVILEA
jgi:hypothetical protein